jgi:hypothetical protein
MIHFFKTLILFLLLLNSVFGTPLTLNNDSSTSFALRYVIGNGQIAPQPLQLNHETLSLELSTNNMPLRAVIRLQPYSINIALFNDRIQITNCDFSPVICEITNHQITFTDRYTSFN